MANKTALAIKHVGFEDLGLLEPLLAERGWRVDYRDAWAGLAAEAADADLVVPLGGPMSVNDPEAYPSIAGEIALAQARIEADRPLLGIYLGAQIMARAIGGTVVKGPRAEIGWAPIALTAAGRSSVLAPLGGSPVLHWHGEMCVLPPGVSALATTEACPAQGFAPSPRSLALQFHAEAGTAGIEPWLAGHAVEIAQTPGVSVPQLRADTARHGAALAAAAGQVFTAWLSQTGFEG